MAMPLPQKIVLKSSTTMSLNDRFSKISAVRPPTIQTYSVNTMGASFRNQRLAQQLAIRNMRPMVNALPVIQRLGVANVKSRLGYSRGSAASIRAFGVPLQRRRGMMYSAQYIQRPRRGVTGVRGAPSTRQTMYRSYTRGVFKGRGQFGGSTRGTYNNPRFSNNNNAVTRGRGRGRGRGGMRGGRGGRSTTPGNPPRESKTAEQLDTELEAYMATS